ncbi:MAG: hypothetical protein GF416_04090 [Candidatus Altiarchaeales archaeon]|nr:hypothetical protein [Candidatus Altiarchaeales archaeon]MBD3416300.1 hypothetical protein [Candidatus Altiarchaeales archaeon]
MKWFYRLSLFMLLLNLSSPMASASTQGILNLVGGLRCLAYALGWLMIVVLGLRYIVADNPSDRQDAKKGMIYVLVAVLVVRSACKMLQLYCDNVQTAVPGINCDYAMYCFPGCNAPTTTTVTTTTLTSSTTCTTMDPWQCCRHGGCDVWVNGLPPISYYLTHCRAFYWYTGSVIRYCICIDDAGPNNNCCPTTFGTGCDYKDDSAPVAPFADYCRSHCTT